MSTDHTMPIAQQTTSSSRQSLWMVLAAFAFSAMGVCVKLASAHYSTGEIVFYRSLIGVALMGAVLYHTGAGVRTPHFAPHIKRSVFGVTSLLLWFSSISLLPLATAMTLNYMSPVWIALIIGAGATLAGKAGGADRKMVTAILMSFVGVICLLQPSVGPSQMTGGMIGLVSGVFTALAYVEVRQLGDLGENEARIVFYFSLVSSIAGGAWMLIAGAHAHTWQSAWLLVAVGLLATLGQTAMTRAYKRGNTLLTANLQYTGIVFASGWGMLLWHDHLNALSWMGMALIIGSGIVTTVMRARQSGVAHPTPQTAVSGRKPRSTRKSDSDSSIQEIAYERTRTPLCHADHRTPARRAAAERAPQHDRVRLQLRSGQPGRRARGVSRKPHPRAFYLHLDNELSGPKTGTNGRHPLPDADAFVARMRALGVNDDTQVVACDRQAGMFAARLWWLMRWVGHADVAVLDGGLPAWEAARLPVDSVVPDELQLSTAPGNLSRKPSLVPLMTADLVLKRLGQPALPIIDARAPDRYRGENETLDPVGGHIPGARNRFFRDNLQADGTFKPAAQLRSDFEAVLAGARPEDAVLQCGSG